jgi:hypothetical protein
VNKHKTAGSVGVRTRDDTATAGDDYNAINVTLDFAQGDSYKEVEIKIIDDHGWEPDEDFYVELYDP